ncbi:MAG TPA: site-2 protease family protein [bacterium]|nr:site-2 protease family protein [bacterium]
MQETLVRILVYVPLLLLAISAHEAAHAWTAFKRGDPTAKDLGRATLMPFVHVDLLGSLILPALLLATQAPFIFGYAKPTPVNPGLLKSPKRDFSLVALAGPCANLALALLFTGVGALAFRAFGFDSPEARLLVGAGIVINVLLFWINLLPLPGLDGLKVLYRFLPDEWCWRLQRGNQFFFPILVLVWVLGLLDLALVPAVSFSSGLCAAAGAGRPPL